MCNQMAFTKGILGTLSTGTKLDFSRNLPEEMFVVSSHVHIKTSDYSGFYLNLAEEGISCLSLLSLVSLKCHVLNGL